MRPGIASLSSIVVSSGTTPERTNCLTARTMSCKSSWSIAHLLAKCTRARGRLEPRIVGDCLALGLARATDGDGDQRRANVSLPLIVLHGEVRFCPDGLASPSPMAARR